MFFVNIALPRARIAGRRLGMGRDRECAGERGA
jgi:hypothetical protein